MLCSAVAKTGREKKKKERVAFNSMGHKYRFDLSLSVSSDKSVVVNITCRLWPMMMVSWVAGGGQYSLLSGRVINLCKME